MTVRCPPILWPSELKENGPPEDPTILLTGSAKIGVASYQVMAIRVRPDLRLQPDLRDDVPKAAYEDSLLYSRLDELGYLAEALSLATIPLEAGSYVIWMVPLGES